MAGISDLRSEAYEEERRRQQAALRSSDENKRRQAQENIDRLDRQNSNEFYKKYPQR